MSAVVHQTSPRVSLQGRHEEIVDSEDTARCNTQLKRADRNSVRTNGLRSRRSVWTTAGFPIGGDTESFPHSDNVMTTAPFAYNMSVPELNRATIKHTVKELECDEVIYGYEREPVFRLTAQWQMQCSRLKVMDSGILKLLLQAETYCN